MATEGEIRHLAHAIWEREGCPKGRADEHWYRAKQFLENQEVAEAAGAPSLASLSNKTVENESCLKVSDWVTFLASEKHGMMSNVLNFGALLVALISIVLIRAGNTTMQAIGDGIFALALIAFVYFWVFRPFEKQGKLAERILDSIMSGKLKNERSIREEWEVGLHTLKRARRRRGSSDK